MATDADAEHGDEEQAVAVRHRHPVRPGVLAGLG